VSTLNATHIFNVYRVRPQKDGSVENEMAARFIEHDGQLHILEDLSGALLGLKNGEIDERNRLILESLRYNSSYIDVVCQDDLDHQRRWDLIEPRDFAAESAAEQGLPNPNPPKPVSVSVFEYERDGSMHTIEFRDVQCFIDGQQTDQWSRITS